MTEECFQCSGDGWLVTNKRAMPCKCAIERRIEARLPKPYLKAKLSDFPEETARIVADSLEEGVRGFLLTGPTGTGKTRMATAICRHHMERGWDARFVTCERYYSDLRKSYCAGTSEEAVIAPLERVHLLVMDDLGAGSLSDHERRFTLALLDRRLNANRPTIVTTNWPLKKIAELMDDRIASRLSMFTGIELSGRDLRVRYGT